MARRNSRIAYSSGVSSHSQVIPTEVVRPWEKWCLAGTIVVSLLLLFCCLRYPVHRSDNVYLYVGAASLAAGHGYADISHPGDPLLTKYPPAQSLAMVPFIRFAGNSLEWLRLGSIFLFPLAIIAAFHLVRSRSGTLVSFAATSLFAFHPVVTWGNLIIGSFGYLAAICIAILWLLDCYPGKNRGVLLGLALVLAFYGHRSTTVLSAAALFWLLMRGHRRETAIAASILLIGAFPWCWRSFSHTGYWLSPEYQQEIFYRVRSCWNADQCSTSGLVRSAPFPLAALNYLWSNLPLTVKALGNLVPWTEMHSLTGWLGKFASPVVWISRAGLTGLIIFGWSRDLHRSNWLNIPFIAFYLPCHLLMISLFVPGIQYIAWLLPSLYLYAATGILSLFPGSLTRRVAGSTALILTLGVSLARHKSFFHPGIPSGDTRLPRWSWVSKATPPEATVYWLYLDDYALSQWRWFDSGRKAVGVARPTRTTLENQDIQHLVIPEGDPLQQYLTPNQWRKLFTEPAGTPGQVSLWQRKLLPPPTS